MYIRAIHPQLVSRYERNDAEIKTLLESIDFYVAPLVNPDGYQYSRKTVSFLQTLCCVVYLESKPLTLYSIVCGAKRGPLTEM